MTAITYVLSSLISGLFKLPYAKYIDIFGRHYGFAFSLVCVTVGFIMMAGCNDVKTFCAAQIFYNTGYSGIDFTLTIFVADTTQLKHRALMIAYTASPWIGVTWAYGPAAESILNTIGFRWGLGIWAIVYPVACTPLFLIFHYYNRKAIKTGIVTSQESGRTFTESLIYYAKEFDVVGLLLVILGLSLFLLSFSLYSYQVEQWKSPMIICFMVFGILFTIAFGLYEKLFAPVSFFPWALMKDRTVIFTFTMVLSLYSTWYIWDSYFYSFLIVVFDESVAHATYITTIYTIGSGVFCFVMGFLIKVNGRLKGMALYFGVPITMLGVGLMIKFRHPGTNIGFIVMCQIFIAFGGGCLVICEQMTVMAVSKQQNIPSILAMEYTIASIGSAIGSAIAGAMWTGIFPKKLAQYLPASAQADLLTIYGSIDEQTSYAVGTPTRDGINIAYGETQKIMLISATCLFLITGASVAMWREIDVRKIKQVRGRVI